MREADSALVEVDDVRLERGAKACLTVDSRRCFRDVDRGMCMRRCGEQELAALRRQCEQASVDEVVQRLGDRQGLPSIHGDAASLQVADDLEGVERVAAGRVAHFVENRPRQHQSQVGLHDAMQRAGVEWTHIDLRDAVAGQRTSELAEEVAFESRTAREEHADALGLQSSARVGEACGRGRVEPLDVIDRDDDGAIVGERTQRRQERETDRVGVRWRSFVVTEEERARKRAALLRRQGRERQVEHGVQQIADAGEREGRLALGRTGSEDAEPTVARFLETSLQEGGLPDAGVAFERDYDRSRGDARHEVA